MLSYAAYGLQVIICSAIMLLYYWLALRNKRFHQYNRFYILAVFILSWIIPLLKIYLFNKREKPIPKIIFLVAGGNNYMDEVVARKGFYVNWQTTVTVFYAIICLFFVAGFIKAIMHIRTLQKNNPAKFIQHFWLVFTNAAGTPFSFFKYVFWNNAIDVNSSTGKQMLRHELVHVNEKHSIDAVLMQIVLCVGWFNPFLWLAKKELNMIHEFIADKKSVENGDTAAFAAMLLTAAYPNQQHLLTQSFSFSPIKRRLFMLTQNKNPKFSYLRRIVVLPLIAIIVLLFAFRMKREENKNTEKLNNNFSLSKNDTTPENANQAILFFKEDSILNSKKNNSSDEPLYVLDGKPISKEEFSNINQKDIERLEVLGDSSINAIIHRKNAKNGVVLLTSRRNLEPNNNDTVVVVGFTTTDNKANPQEGYNKVFTDVQVPASFPGGIIAWQKYLERNLNSDIPIQRGAPPGKYIVILSFIVDAKGNVSNVKAENNPGYGTAAEAIRVIEQGPAWVPATQNGQTVASLRKQTLTFIVVKEAKFSPPKIVKDTVDIPSAFSPTNGDRFVIKSNLTEQNISLTVFNRWGNVVYKNDNYKNDWDGRGNKDSVDGKNLAKGTYYAVTIIDTSTYMKAINLK